MDHFTEGMNGTVILPNGCQVQSMILKSQQSPTFTFKQALKTVNIYFFSRSTMVLSLMPKINQWIINGWTDQFYEAVIAQLIATGDLELEYRLAGDNPWFEVDTLEELCLAEMHLRTSPLTRFNK